uniref:Protein FAM221B n=1 Tax=Callorhinchus milii TaxID=7868 RepID=A0A4W3IDQ8_CALMI
MSAGRGGGKRTEKSPFPVSRYPSQKQNQISVKGSTGRGSSNVPGPSNQALVPFPSGFSKGKVMLAPKGTVRNTFKVVIHVLYRYRLLEFNIIMCYANARTEPESSRLRGECSNHYVAGLQKIMSNVKLPFTGYTVKPIIPADKAELISVAKAMHQDQFGARVKELFDPEREAALDAIRSGIYIGWRSPEYKWDCIRVGIKSKCFCGHLLAEHERFSAQSVRVPCAVNFCQCKAFAFVPARPEDVGEFWLRKRPNFDPRTWRAKCRCKHSHEEHDPSGSHHCTISGCPCSQFESNFLCAACDKHWEQHATFFDSEQSRKQNGLPYGKEIAILSPLLLCSLSGATLWHFG